MDKAKVKNKIVTVARKIAKDYNLQVLDAHMNKDIGFMIVLIWGEKFNIDLRFNDDKFEQPVFDVRFKRSTEIRKRFKLMNFIVELEKLVQFDIWQEKQLGEKQ